MEEEKEEEKEEERKDNDEEEEEKEEKGEGSVVVKFVPLKHPTGHIPVTNTIAVFT